MHVKTTQIINECIPTPIESITPHIHKLIQNPKNNPNPNTPPIPPQLMRIPRPTQHKIIPKLKINAIKEIILLKLFIIQP